MSAGSQRAKQRAHDRDLISRKRPPPYYPHRQSIPYARSGPNCFPSAQLTRGRVGAGSSFFRVTACLISGDFEVDHAAVRSPPL